MKFVRKDYQQQKVSFSNSFEVQRINYFTYKVVLSNEIIKQSNNLILFQSYSPGWIAFTNGKFLDHVLINSWANGWKINSEAMKQSSNVLLIFWPQYLEFVGFILLVTVFLRILLIKEKHD